MGYVTWRINGFHKWNGRQKTIFQPDDVPIHTTATIKKWFQDYHGIQFWSATDRKSMGNSSKKCLRSGEATYGRYRWS